MFCDLVVWYLKPFESGTNVTGSRVSRNMKTSEQHLSVWAKTGPSERGRSSFSRHSCTSWAAAPASSCVLFFWAARAVWQGTSSPPQPPPPHKSFTSWPAEGGTQGRREVAELSKDSASAHTRTGRLCNLSYIRASVFGEMNFLWLRWTGIRCHYIYIFCFSHDSVHM